MPQLHNGARVLLRHVSRSCSANGQQAVSVRRSAVGQMDGRYGSRNSGPQGQLCQYGQLRLLSRARTRGRYKRASRAHRSRTAGKGNQLVAARKTSIKYIQTTALSPRDARLPRHSNLPSRAKSNSGADRSSFRSAAAKSGNEFVIGNGRRCPKLGMQDVFNSVCGRRSMKRLHPFCVQ